MTDEEALALGRRAVACASWRWLPGMLDLMGGRRYESRHGQTSRMSVRAALFGDYAFVPDLRDAATRGAVLDLVREAFDCPRCFVQATWVPADSWQAWTPGGSIEGPTEAEALVRALESAPTGSGQ